MCIKKNTVAILITTFVWITVVAVAAAAAISGETGDRVYQFYQTQRGMAERKLLPDMGNNLPEYAVSYTFSETEDFRTVKTAIADGKEEVFVSPEMAAHTTPDFWRNVYADPDSWPVKSLSVTTDANGTAKIEADIEYQEDASKADADEAEMLKKTESLRLQVMDTKNPYKKIQLINDWICENAEYNDAACADNELYQEVKGANSVILDGTGICRSYAATFCWIATRCDMRVAYVSGTAGGGSHAWNIVDTGECGYVAVDTTWNDTTRSDEWLCLSVEQMEEDHQTECVWWF